jgi:hypothetical protein
MKVEIGLRFSRKGTGEARLLSSIEVSQRLNMNVFTEINPTVAMPFKYGFFCAP